MSMYPISITKTTDQGVGEAFRRQNFIYCSQLHGAGGHTVYYGRFLILDYGASSEFSDRFEAVCSVFAHSRQQNTSCSMAFGCCQ